jgi:hypothetical protein
MFLSCKFESAWKRRAYPYSTCEETSYQTFDANVSLWDQQDPGRQDLVDGITDNIISLDQTTEITGWSNFSATISEARVQMTRITVDTLRLYYSVNHAKISAAQILGLYVRYLTWRDKLPAVLKAIAKEKSEFHPHILLLQYVDFRDVSQS